MSRLARISAFFGELPTFLAENVLFSLAMWLLSPHPTTPVLAVSAVSAWYLFHKWSVQPHRELLANFLDRTFPHESPRVHRWGIWTRVVAALIVAPFIFAAWGPLDRRLWASGQFGEPPDNRYVRFWSIIKTTEHVSEALFEIGVRYVQVNGFSIAMGFEDWTRDGTKVSHWLGPPGDLRVLPEGERHGASGEHYGDGPGTPYFFYRADTPSVTPTESLYVYISRTKPLVPGEIVFGDYFDLHGWRWSDGGLDVIAVTKGTPVPPKPKPKDSWFKRWTASFVGPSRHE